MGAIFEPGFFGSGPVQTALVAGGIVAVVSAVVGVIAVLRAQSFAGHAIGDVSTLGGSASFLAGVNPVFGYLVLGALAGGTMELLGFRRRERDVATGVVLGAALGLSALFLYFDTTLRSTSGAAVTILFGSLFAVPPDTVPLLAGLGAAGLVLVAVLFRPLLLSSLHPDLAAARGLPVRLLGIVFLTLTAIAVSLSALAVGTILSTALLIGPAATALRLARRPLTAVAVATTLGLAATWIGILLAYDSYYWPPADRGWPVSFFVVALVFVFYVVADNLVWRKTKRHGPLRPEPEH